MINDTNQIIFRHPNDLTFVDEWLKIQVEERERDSSGNFGTEHDVVAESFQMNSQNLRKGQQPAFFQSVSQSKE